MKKLLIVLALGTIVGQVSASAEKYYSQLSPGTYYSSVPNPESTPDPTDLTKQITQMTKERNKELAIAKAKAEAAAAKHYAELRAQALKMAEDGEGVEGIF